MRDIGLGTPPEIPAKDEAQWADPVTLMGGTPNLLEGTSSQGNVFNALTAEPLWTIVDGAEAEVRIMRQPPLVEISVAELIHDLAKLQAQSREAKIAAKKAKQHYDDLADRAAAIVDELCSRDEPQQDALPFEEEG